MLAEQRQREILSQLAHTGSVRVGELAERFPVSEETIRRDLAKLEAQSMLRRTHGGAVSVDVTVQEEPFDVRRVAFIQRKRAIAQAASAYVEAGDVLAIDASSTAHQLARALPDIPLTVVTNALTAISELSRRRNIDVYSTGGRLDAEGRCCVGPLAEQALEQLNFTKLFFSCKGVDLERGLSEVNDEHARIKRAMLERAQLRYLLVDASKFGLRSLVCYSGLEQVDTLVTDDGISRETVAALTEQGIAPHVARAAENVEV